uniref:Polyprotein n=1 Tax=Haemonchus placei TaxID=6290 RepID=A0A0N4VYM5_HAEPC
LSLTSNGLKIRRTFVTDEDERSFKTRRITDDTPAVKVPHSTTFNTVIGRTSLEMR